MLSQIVLPVCKQGFDQGKWQEWVCWQNRASEDKELSALMSVKRLLCGPGVLPEHLHVVGLEGVGPFHAVHLQTLECFFFWNTLSFGFSLCPIFLLPSKMEHEPAPLAMLKKESEPPPTKGLLPARFIWKVKFLLKYVWRNEDHY